MFVYALFLPYEKIGHAKYVSPFWFVTIYFGCLRTFLLVPLQTTAIFWPTQGGRILCQIIRNQRLAWQPQE
jgi:hypothetical protein